MKRLLLEIGRGLKGYGKPVREILAERRDGEYEVLSPFINTVCLCEDERFCDNWCESLKAFNSEKQFFKYDEMNLLISFGNRFGYGDAEEQTELVNTTVSYFEEFESAAAREASKQGKLKLMLPIYVGAVVCILII